MSRVLNVYVFFVAIFVAGYVLFPPFRSWANLNSLLGNATPLIMVALGQLFAMLVWGVDLSVGSIMNVTVVTGSFLLAGGVSEAIFGAFVCVLLGALLGLVNGILITRLRLPDFVVTMATFISYEGVALTIRPTPGGSVNPAFTNFMYENILHIPCPTWVLVVLVAVFAYLLRATRTGHYMVAVGSDRDNSYLLGLPVDRIRVTAYVMSGVCSAIAGIFLIGLIGTGAANAANPYQLNSIIATVVGGTSLYGGVGSVIGTVFGALILQGALKMLSYTNLLGSYVLVFEGALVVLVVALASTAGYLRLQRRAKSGT